MGERLPCTEEVRGSNPLSSTRVYNTQNSELKITNANSPVLFTTNGYKLVMMPMATGEAAKSTEAKPDVVAQAEAVAQAVEPAKPPARRPKPKRKAREAVAVA